MQVPSYSQTMQWRVCGVASAARQMIGASSRPVSGPQQAARGLGFGLGYRRERERGRAQGCSGMPWPITRIFNQRRQPRDGRCLAARTREAIGCPLKSQTGRAASPCASGTGRTNRARARCGNQRFCRQTRLQMRPRTNHRVPASKGGG